MSLLPTPEKALMMVVLIPVADNGDVASPSDFFLAPPPKKKQKKTEKITKQKYTACLCGQCRTSDHPVVWEHLCSHNDRGLFAFGCWANLERTTSASARFARFAFPRTQKKIIKKQTNGRWKCIPRRQHAARRKCTARLLREGAAARDYVHAIINRSV